MMNLEISGIVKFGFYTAAILLTTDVLFSWYVRQRNRITQRPINEVHFIMSNDITCCSSKSDDKRPNNCKNPNCKTKLMRKIIQHIDSAKHMICIAIYMFTNRHFGEAILRAKRRGVKIRMISDQSMIASSGSQINVLQVAGIPVRIAGNGEKYMHNKFCLIDVLHNENSTTENLHPQKGLLINGSMNWTTNGLDRNWENVIFTSDEHLKNEFKNAFDQMWAKHA